MTPPAIPGPAVAPTSAVLSSGAMTFPNDLGHVEAPLRRKQNVVLYGPPGTGKTYAAFRIADAWESAYGSGSVFRTTFHPSYAYEDFVHGFRPRTTDPSTYALQDGVLLEAAARAWEFERACAGGGPTRSVLLVIDEINRADVARVFGELITFIEADKRGVAFRFAQLPSQTYAIPRNLFIVGTMNTADKSVSLLDIALRRRFAFIPFDPDPAAFAAVPEWTAVIDGLDMGELLQWLNSRLINLGIESDRAIGHALLAVPDAAPQKKEVLRQVIADDVVPLVQEYFYMDRERVRRLLGDLVNPLGRFDSSLTADEVHSLLVSFVQSPSAGTSGGSSPSPAATGVVSTAGHGVGVASEDEAEEDVTALEDVDEASGDRAT